MYSNGEPVAVNSDNGVSYFGTDILGSVRSVTDRNGQVKASYEYDAFGTPYLSNLENDVGFGYTGKIFDSATGLYDYGFRDYAPNSARFTTVDPVRDGSNWFSYVVNDPVNYIDPLGLTPSDAGNISSYGPQTRDKTISIEAMNRLHDAGNAPDLLSERFLTDYALTYINDNNISYDTHYIVIRPTDGNGNSFDSHRMIVKDDGITADVVFQDNVGANCKESYDKLSPNNFTEPDGEYTVKKYGDSQNLSNVLSHHTDDSNISEDKRNIINNTNNGFFDHANEFKDGSGKKKGPGPYNQNKEPGSAGCTIGEDGEWHHDVFVDILFAGEADDAEIRKTITSVSNGDR